MSFLIERVSVEMLSDDNDSASTTTSIYDILGESEKIVNGSVSFDWRKLPRDLLEDLPNPPESAKKFIREQDATYRQMIMNKLVGRSPTKVASKGNRFDQSNPNTKEFSRRSENIDINDTKFQYQNYAKIESLQKERLALAAANNELCALSSDLQVTMG